MKNKKEEVVISPLEVKVMNNNFDEAFRRFKALVQKEKIVSLYKEKQAYEKPSIKKRRKEREALERKLLAESREKQILNGEWDKRQKRKEQKRKLRQADHKKRSNENQE